MNLRVEINECRNQLNARDSLIKEMQMELADPQKKFLLTNELKVGIKNLYINNYIFKITLKSYLDA